MIMLNHLPAQLDTFKAIKQEESYKDSTLPSTMELINQIKEHAWRIDQENIVNFHKTKSRDNARSKSNNNRHRSRNQDTPNTIPLSWWGVEIFLWVDERPSEFWKDDNVFDYADIIDDQYVVWGNAY